MRISRREIWIEPSPYHLNGNHDTSSSTILASKCAKLLMVTTNYRQLPIVVGNCELTQLHMNKLGTRKLQINSLAPHNYESNKGENTESYQQSIVLPNSIIPLLLHRITSFRYSVVHQRGVSSEETITRTCFSSEPVSVSMTNVRIMASSSGFLELQHRLPRTDVMAVVGLLLWLFLLLCHAGGVCPDIIAFVSHFFAACC